MIGFQCEWARPVPHIPQERGFPLQSAADAELPALEAKTESFFASFAEPQCGHLAPAQSVVRTSSSLSFSHFEQ